MANKKQTAKESLVLTPDNDGEILESLNATTYNPIAGIYLMKAGVAQSPAQISYSNALAAIPGYLYIWGNFGGGDVVIQVSPDGGTTWIPATNPTTGAALSITAPITVYLPHVGNMLLQAVITGATSPTVNILLARP